MTFQLRDYQIQAIENIHTCWENNTPKVVTSIATGLGKTEIAFSAIDRLARNRGGLENVRILVIAQSTALIYQFYRRFVDKFPTLVGPNLRYTPYNYPSIGIEMANHINPSARITVATRQTLAREGCARLKDILTYGQIDLLVIDEAHHSVSQEYLDIYQTLVDRNPSLLVLGLTATLVRSDGLSLGIMFDKIAAEYSIQYGITHGWLKPIRSYKVDAVLPSLEEENPMKVSNWMNLHFDVWRDMGGENRKTLHFLPTLEVARLYTKFLHEKGIRSVHVDSMLCIDIDGQTHEDKGIPYHTHRMAIMDKIQSGEVDYVCNRGIFSEGWDWRYCDCIVNSITTESDSTWTQRWGRGTRLPVGVNNLRHFPESNQYRIVYEGSDAPTTLDVSALSFNPYTLGLDFSASTARMSTLGTLQGALKQEVIAVEELEEKEEIAEGFKNFRVKQAETAIEVKVREVSPFRQLPTMWYGGDIENETSTSFGMGQPYMLYITAPKLRYARTVSNRMQVLKDEGGDLASLRRLENLYNILANWMIWVVEAEETSWGSTWTRCTPASLFFGTEGIQLAYSDLSMALGPAALTTELLIRHMDKDFDFEGLKRLAKNTNPPSEKQLKLLKTTVTKLQKLGGNDP